MKPTPEMIDAALPFLHAWCMSSDGSNEGAVAALSAMLAVMPTVERYWWCEVTGEVEQPYWTGEMRTCDDTCPGPHRVLYIGEETDAR